MAREQISIAFDPKILREIRVIALREGVSIAEVVRDILDKHFKDKGGIE